VNSSIINSNFAYDGGGITNFGSLEMNNSTLSGHSVDFAGGGLLNINGSAVLNNSTINGNTGFEGGGISNAGTMELSNSTINNNNVYSGGGGIQNNSFGILTINNSTLSGNGSFGGGGIANGGTLTVTNSTLSGNNAPYYGGGIQNYGSANLTRTIISGNFSSNGAEVFNSYLAVVNADNYNVIGYDGDARSSGFTAGPNDLIPPGPLDTVLNPALADNGGSTLTHALAPDSIAIDAAPSDACLAPPVNGIDQRGFPRNVDGNGVPSQHECDSGAFEFVPVGTPTPTLTPTATHRATRTSQPPVTATPRSSPTPTRTPRSTTLPYPPLPTSTAILPAVGQGIGPAASLQAKPSNILIQFIAETIEALKSLL
jgi:hypothetical protein